MTTAHRPTFDPARGKELPKGPAYHQRLLPAHTKLKTRQPGQGGDADREVRDLRAELMRAEAAAREKKGGVTAPRSPSPSHKRVADDADDDDEEVADIESKRRKILEATRDIDADSDGDDDGDEDNDDDEESSDDDDDEDETAELMRELEKIKRERTEQREKEVSGMEVGRENPR